MIVLISPAKTLDFQSPAPTKLQSECEFLKDSQKLISEIKKLDVTEIGRLMKLSDKLATLNTDRFQSWHLPFTKANSKQALFAFKGDVYTGLESDTLAGNQIKFAQRHVRILSGLYGLMKPLDLMQPYRLEMGTKFQNSRGKDLYQFWGNKITSKLNDDLAQSNGKILINLASNEYFKAIKTKDIESRVITPIFKDQKNGRYKIISFFAKKARGMMVRYAIDHHISEPNDLKKFNYGGYKYNAAQSTVDRWIFLRSQSL